ncbi:hypothetical protein [Mycolicibacterium sp. S3B2]|uniref:hypothetical protein n=1 Tax=Mycolicibacterium sp. S3B2 TaxID=3415120 RepID=UPI003C7C3BC0
MKKALVLGAVLTTAAGVALAAPAGADDSFTITAPDGGVVTTTWIGGGQVRANGRAYVTLETYNGSQGLVTIQGSTYTAICPDGTRLPAKPPEGGEQYSNDYTVPPGDTKKDHITFDGFCYPVALDTGDSVIGEGP